MGNDLMPVIITIAVASLIIVGSNIATFVILLNHLGGRIDQSEARVTQAATRDKAELQEIIRDSEQRLTETMRSDKAELQETMRSDKAELQETMRSDKAELQETMRSDKAELLDAIRDSEQRLSRRLDRSEDRTDANFEALRREYREREAEQTVAGDD